MNMAAFRYVVSMYNDDDSAPTLAPGAEPELVFQQLKMEGFLVQRWTNRWLEGLNQMLQWIDEVLDPAAKICRVENKHVKTKFCCCGRVGFRYVKQSLKASTTYSKPLWKCCRGVALEKLSFMPEWYLCCSAVFRE